MYAPAEHWRSVIYRDLVWHRRGTAFTVRDAYAAIHRAGIALDRSSPRPRARAVVGWLAHLEREGYLDVERDPRQPGQIVKITVRGDLEQPPEPRAAPARPPAPPTPTRQPAEPATPRPPASPARSAAVTREPTVDLVRLVLADLPERPRPSPRPPDGNQPLQRATCRRCRQPLDPVLAEHGLHIGC